jgi:cyclase
MNLPKIALSSLVAVFSALLPAQSEKNTVREVALGVFFHLGDSSKGHSNNGWIVFEDYILVIDANYPSGAKVVMPKVADSSEKPVRVVFDTHHHPDHAYGNRLWSDAGALLVAQSGVVEQMEESEPANWDSRALFRPDMRETLLKAPSVLFDEDLFFDDGERRVELHYYGAGHTKGDGYAWLPEEKILFTGDGSVNGAYNYMGDANIGEWIQTL